MWTKATSDVTYPVKPLRNFPHWFGFLGDYVYLFMEHYVIWEKFWVKVEPKANSRTWSVVWRKEGDASRRRLSSKIATAFGRQPMVQKQSKPLRLPWSRLLSLIQCVDKTSRLREWDERRNAHDNFASTPKVYSDSWCMKIRCVQWSLPSQKSFRRCTLICINPMPGMNAHFRA